jgi:hypothetical protein
MNIEVKIVEISILSENVLIIFSDKKAAVLRSSQIYALAVDLDTLTAIPEEQQGQR